jgi:hypothetical protein
MKIAIVAVKMVRNALAKEIVTAKMNVTVTKIVSAAAKKRSTNAIVNIKEKINTNISTNVNVKIVNVKRKMKLDNIWQWHKDCKRILTITEKELLSN